MNGFAGESPVGWAEINYVLLSDDGGLTWRASDVRCILKTEELYNEMMNFML